MWVIAVLAGLAALLVFILWVPLDMLLNAEIYGKPQFRLRLSWFFGLISRDITGGKEKPKKKPVKPKKKKVGGKRNLRENLLLVFRLLKTKGLARRVRILFKDLFSSIKFREMVADFEIGLGDPADTGQLFALFGPATVFLGSSRWHMLRLQPSFSDDVVLRGYSRGEIRTRPILLITPLLKFIFSLPAMRVARTLISNRWKRRKK